MDKNLLKEIVLEQSKAQKAFDRGVEREELKRLKRYIPMPHAVIITGIRRVGKSTLLAQIADEFYGGNVYYFNFEDERLLDFSEENFENLYEVFLEVFGESKVFFFDEVQNVQNWEVFVRRMQAKGYKFFITGSNATLLSRELGTKLTGRCVTIELYPFSFKEFLDFQGHKLPKDAFFYTTERARIKKYFNEYMVKGGMPEYLKYKDPVVLKRVYEDILYRDIVARYDIKEVKALREIGLYFLSNISCPFSYNKLKQLLRLGSVNTVKSYADYLENSFLIFTTNRFSYSLKQQFVAPKKAYCIDNGLVESVAFQFSKNKGRFLENLVFMTLRHEYSDIYYYITSNNLEVDFLIRRGRRPVKLIQATEALGEKKARDREFKALKEAMRELKVKDVLILTLDEDDSLKIDGITVKIKPVYKWLLEGKQ